MGTSLWHVRPSLYVLQVYIKTYLKDNFFIWAIFLGGGRFSLIYTVRGHNVSFSFHGVVTIQLAALNLRISLDRITRYSK